MTDQELNEACARKLGWTKFHRTAADAYFWLSPTQKSEEDCHICPPDYCHSIEAAWEISEYVKRYTNGSLGIFWMPTKRQYRAIIDYGVGLNVHQDADTAPMAIVLAFLKLSEGETR